MIALPRFTEHARNRFMSRSPDVAQAEKALPTHEVAALMARSYRHARPVSRAEAKDLIGRPVGRHRGDFFYRAEPHENPGIWIAWWIPGRAETVITYLAPGEMLDDTEVDSIMDGLLEPA